MLFVSLLPTTVSKPFSKPLSVPLTRERRLAKTFSLHTLHDNQQRGPGDSLCFPRRNKFLSQSSAVELLDYTDWELLERRNTKLGRIRSNRVRPSTEQSDLEGKASPCPSLLPVCPPGQRYSNALLLVFPLFYTHSRGFYTDLCAPCPSPEHMPVNEHSPNAVTQFPSALPFPHLGFSLSLSLFTDSLRCWGEGGRNWPLGPFIWTTYADWMSHFSTLKLHRLYLPYEISLHTPSDLGWNE